MHQASGRLSRPVLRRAMRIGRVSRYLANTDQATAAMASNKRTCTMQPAVLKTSLTTIQSATSATASQRNKDT
jgi:hypothetical protein